MLRTIRHCRCCLLDSNSLRFEWTGRQTGGQIGGFEETSYAIIHEYMYMYDMYIDEYMYVWYVQDQQVTVCQATSIYFGFSVRLTSVAQPNPLICLSMHSVIEKSDSFPSILHVQLEGMINETHMLWWPSQLHLVWQHPGLSSFRRVLPEAQQTAAGCNAAATCWR